jgi:hypothetical protein
MAKVFAGKFSRGVSVYGLALELAKNSGLARANLPNQFDVKVFNEQQCSLAVTGC